MKEANEVLYKELLAALTEAFESEPLVPEDDGRTMLGLDNNMGLILEVTEGDGDEDFAGDDEIALLVATVYIGGLPEHPEEILMDALQANYYFAGTEGAVLALEPESNALVAYRGVPLNTPADMVKLMIGKLVGLARAWKARLSSGESGENQNDFGNFQNGFSNFIRI